MAKEEVTADALSAKEERKRQKKALKKSSKKRKKQEYEEEGVKRATGTNQEDQPTTARAEESENKPTKTKKPKKRDSECSVEGQERDTFPEMTTGVLKKPKKKGRKKFPVEENGEPRQNGEPGMADGSNQSQEVSSLRKKKSISTTTEAQVKGNSGQKTKRAPIPDHGENASSVAASIRVEGMVVTPLKDFASAKMPADVMKYITERGWKQPTPIQSHCWPVLNAGRDVVGIAETGSGKTLAFSLPAMSRIFSSKAKIGSKRQGPLALVLAPTRELALQSAEVIAEAGGHCGIRSACIYGGVPKREQRIALGGGRGGGRSVEVVVATPGRLKDLVGEGACDLSQVTSLVLDEADRMLDLGFEQDVREIIGCCAADSKRQTAMFSATWPKSIRDLAAEFLNNPVKVTVGADDLTANSRVEQHVEVVEERERDGKLLKLLNKCHATRKNRVLVFALYKREAARLEQFLQRNQFDAVAVHGDKGQAQREQALSQFKSKERPLMVATDVAARGLDIPDVEYVINYSFPLTIEDYIHRIGRTGRAGKKGVSHTFFHQGDKARAGELVNVLQEANQKVPEALTKFGTHVKKKEHKLYGAFAKDVDMDKTSKKTTFDDSDDE